MMKLKKIYKKKKKKVKLAIHVNDTLDFLKFNNIFLFETIFNYMIKKNYYIIKRN